MQVSPFNAFSLPLDLRDGMGSNHSMTPANIRSTAQSFLPSSLVSLLLAYAILITGNGLLSTLVSLRLIQGESSSIVAGVVQSAYYVGLTAGALFGGVLIGRVGHRRAFVVFGAVVAICALGYTVSSSPWAWVGVRFVTGFCLVGVFNVVESQLHEVSTNARRARVFSAYLVVNYLGVAMGQFLIGVADTAGFALFGIASAVFSASLIPITVAGGPWVAPEKAAPAGSRAILGPGLAGLRTVYRQAPFGLLGCLGAGLLTSSFFTMQPVFMRRVGYPVAEVAHFMGFALISALVLQWPVARLADRLDRRKIVLGVALLAGSCSLSLFFFTHDIVIRTLGYVYVSLIFTMYGLATSYVNDSISSSQRVAVSASLLLIFSLGASAGPTLASVAMAFAGPAGLYLFTAAVNGGLALLAFRSLAR
jgi:MFS family permease